jgi:7,8-dihydroneopterin aldolase/epimerase/oxygenase
MTIVPLKETRTALSPRSHRILLEELAVDADIGFHDFEIGIPQRLLVCVEVTLDLAHWPQADTREQAWNYDFIRTGIHALVKGRRFNLQEVLAEEIFAMIAAVPGVIGLKVSTRKPDVYPDAKAVGIVISSD